MVNQKPERQFPLLATYAEIRAGLPRAIPWHLAEEAYRGYAARYGASQSLERIAERGGFGPGELDLFVPGWRKRTQ